MINFSDCLLVFAAFFPFLVMLLLAAYLRGAFRNYKPDADLSDITGEPVTMADLRFAELRSVAGDDE